MEKKNIALKEILEQIEIEKKEIKDSVIANADNVLIPTLKKMKLKGISKKYVELLTNNLEDLTSSFGKKISEKNANLTSREIEICDLIKNGLTNKQMADLLNVSLATVERHRANIRRKLGITNKEVNLTSFLKGL